MVDRFHKDYRHGMDSQFSMHVGELAFTTNPQVANQLNELGTRLNEGMSNVEVGTLSQDLFDAIPKQHTEEMRRLSKLTDSKLSLHAPLTDPAGFRENNWHEHTRKMAEQEFKDVINRSFELDPEGGMPVNFHSSGGGVAANIWEKKEKLQDEGKMAMGVVNTETGQIQLIPKEELNWLTGEKTMTPEDRLRDLNYTSWDQEKLDFMSLKKQKEEED
jgi:hypothetical protein